MAVPVMKGEFELHIEIISPNIVKTKMLERDTHEPYTLHLTSEAGTFVGQVREEYERVLGDICEKCFEYDVFKTQQSRKLIEHIYEKYKGELEFLWEKSPDAAIVRRKDNKKWYIVFMVIKKDRLGIDSQEPIEVIDIRVKTENMPELLEQGNIYPGYHMNKKHWITIILDGSVSLVEIYKLLDKSYELALK
ncbi:MAG: MmcQ/YjbR family DNA-binding protein [bacterium]|nr:MmcQ/YjbR family DNA-binding protein [bacterium]